MKIRVYYEDTDAGGIVYHSNYLNFCERARSEIFFESGVNFDKQNGHFVIKSINANYISSAKLGDLVEVKNKILSKKPASVELLQTIFLKDSEIFNLKILLVFIKGDKISKIPKELVQIFDNF
jgi:acyl-CoA thioester hydrolase